MRIKVRYTTGGAPPAVLTIPNTDPISSLVSQIKESRKISGEIEVKHGFPPKILDFAAFPADTPLESLPFKLDGDQLTVHCLDEPSSSPPAEADPVPEPSAPKPSTSKPSASKPSASKRGLVSFGPPPSNKDDPPDVLLPNRGTVVLRVMEDDNSCLFRALSYVLTNGLTSPTELRQIVTSGIQGDPITYNEAVLGQAVDDYCNWISNDTSWGGGIELSILAKFFETEIVAIDVSTLSVMRFNDPRPLFCVVVYSGIHYDALALSPITAFSFSSSPDEDVRIFQMEDQEILNGAMELVAKLKKKNYFTDTKKFTLKCTTCGAALIGEEDARGHAKRTGHTGFGEY